MPYVFSPEWYFYQNHGKFTNKSKNKKRCILFQSFWPSRLFSGFLPWMHKGHRLAMLLLDHKLCVGTCGLRLLAVFLCLFAPRSGSTIKADRLEFCVRLRKSFLGNSTVAGLFQGEGKGQRKVLFCQVHCSRVRRLEEVKRMLCSLSACLSAQSKLLLFSL